MKSLFMKLGNFFLFILLPLFIFIYFFPISAILAKYVIAEKFDNLKVKNAIFILPLYSPLAKDGLVKLNVKIDPVSKNNLVSNLETKNIIINYQGFSIDFENGKGNINGNYKKINFVYRAYGNKSNLYLKGYVLTFKKYLYVDGKLKFRSLEFPIKYKGNIEKLVKYVK